MKQVVKTMTCTVTVVVLCLYSLVLVDSRASYAENASCAKVTEDLSLILSDSQGGPRRITSDLTDVLLHLDTAEANKVSELIGESRLAGCADEKVLQHFSYLALRGREEFARKQAKIAEDLPRHDKPLPEVKKAESPTASYQTNNNTDASTSY